MGGRRRNGRGRMTAKRPPWLQQQPAGKRLCIGRNFARGKKGACEIRRSRGSSRLPHRELPRPRRICRPAASAGFCFLGSGSRGLAELEPCTRPSPRTSRACAMRRATAIAGVVKPPVADRCPRTSILGAADGYTCRAAGHCRTVVRAPHRLRPASRNGPAGEPRSPAAGPR